MRTLRLLLAAILMGTALSACAVPHKKSSYRMVRNLAIQLADPKPLSTVESGPLLAIDNGSFEIAQKLAEKQKVDTSKLDVFGVRAPLVKKYPLWFMAKVRDNVRGVVRVQVFERATSVDPWLLVSSPEILLDTTLPTLSGGPDGTFIPVGAKQSGELSSTPQQVADAYAKVLEDPKAAEVGDFEDDGFIKQMRSSADANRLLKNVTFVQSWAAEKVQFAARTTDGGFLVWATLLRLDGYGVKEGVAVTFPDGSPQKAFLAKDITTSGKLRYYHQVLLYAPGPGGGKPRALGQYGGVVGADGF